MYLPLKNWSSYVLSISTGKNSEIMVWHLARRYKDSCLWAMGNREKKLSCYMFSDIRSRHYIILTNEIGIVQSHLLLWYIYTIFPAFLSMLYLLKARISIAANIKSFEHGLKASN